MEFRQIKSFLALAESLSFTKASQQIYLTQPALSTQIRNLERELGVILFDRTRHKVEITEAGRVFQAEARELTELAARALRRTRQASRGEVGLLRIGYVSSAALEIVPPLIRDFRGAFPEVQIELQNMRTTEQAEALREKRIDVGFLRLPHPDPDLRVAAIHRESFVAVFAKSHRLAGARRFSLAALAREEFVAYGRRYAPGFYDQILKACHDAGFSPKVIQETGEMHTTIALIGAGLGVGILPLAPVAAQPRDITYRKLPASFPKSEIGIVTRRDETSRVVANLLKILTAGGWLRAHSRAEG